MKPTKEYLERYKAHISLCEIDLPGQEKLRQARVLVVGAGGLGSPVCLYLAAAGAGTIGVVDPDTVSLSNLQRQIAHGTADLGRRKVDSVSESMRALNPEVNVVTYCERLETETGRELVENYDIVVDCTDNFVSRSTIAVLCREAGRPYIYGAVSRFGGQLFTWVPGAAGYADYFGDEPRADDVPCAINGVLNALVGTVGSLQAAEVIKLITGAGEPLVNRLLVIDLLTMEFNTFRITPSK